MEVKPFLTRVLNNHITVRRASSADDYRACQQAQRTAWGIREEGYIIPAATMAGANLHGGLVLGAFLPDGRAVAMSFAFLGRIDDRLCLYSQLTGVVPGYQSQGIGREMKFLQRDFARAEGLSLIAWAFDPLQAGNAAFNLQRLGATARRYVDNMYGERTDALNNGVATDRLIAEWDLDDQREEQPPFDPDVASNLPAWLGSIVCAGGRRTPRAVAHTEHPHRALLEIPPNIAELRKEQPEVAEEWRRAVREAFHTAFVTGYRAIGFLREASSGEHQCHYLLERDSGGNVDPV